MADTPSPAAARKPARIWRNFRIGKGGDEALTQMQKQGGALITYSDVVRECLAEVLGSEVSKRRVIRRLETEHHRREDAANERAHRQAKRA